MVSFISNKVCVVTGGAGFIGSHLVHALLEQGAARVIVIDSMQYANQVHLPNTDKVELVTFTMGTDDIAILKPYLIDADYVFHLAAQKHNQSIDSPNVVYQANIIGTSELFDLAGECGVKKVIFSSSLYAYGQMTLPAMVETDMPDPKTIYGISKLAGEQLLKHFAQKHGYAYAIMRYFFVYGPKQFPGMGYKSVIVKNFERLINNDAPVIFGSGEQALDYIYIDDVVRATIGALEEKASGNIFNVSSGVATSINELTALMSEVAGSSLQPDMQPADWTEGTVRVGDNTKITTTLDWKPRVALQEGLAKTLEWLKSNKV